MRVMRGIAERPRRRIDGAHLFERHHGIVYAAGKPQLAFTDQAAEFIRANAIVSVHVSLADEEDHAVAFVTLARG